MRYTDPETGLRTDRSSGQSGAPPLNTDFERWRAATVGTASYKLARILGGWPHFADVTASAEFGGGHSVAVSPGAFAWLKDAYGPHAREGPVCDAYRAAAISGVEFALRHIAGRPGIPEAQVVIDRINVSPTDTTPDDVEYASVFAVWRALGVEGRVQPALPGKHAEPSGSGGDMLSGGFRRRT